MMVVVVEPGRVDEVVDELLVVVDVGVDVEVVVDADVVVDT